MAFIRPTLSEIVTRVETDLASRLGLSSPILRRSVVYIIARVIAGVAHMLHGHIAWAVGQIFPDQSEREYLLRWGGLFGLALKPAEYAAGPVTVSGTPATVVPAGARLLRADGRAYVVDIDTPIGPAGTESVPVTAELAGADGNAAAGVELVFESPIPNVDATAVVAAAGIVNGSDEESVEAFRARVLARMAEPPHGGNAADYIAWALEVPGVTRAWCDPTWNGPGTVRVLFVRDDDASIIPDAAEVQAVQDHIDAVAPVTADVTVAAPSADPMDVTVHIVPDTSETKASVEAELRDLVRREAVPGGTLLLSHIRNAIGDAAGVTDYTLTSPNANVNSAAGHLITLGAVNFV